MTRIWPFRLIEKSRINALAIKTGRTANTIITIGVHVRDVPSKTS